MADLVQTVSSSPAVIEETKSEKSKRLMNKRVTNLLKACSLIKNLGSAAYTYTPEQIDRVLEVIDFEREQIEIALKHPKKSNTIAFSL